MADFLRWLEDRYDLIVIDTPPAAMVSDTIPLITMARGVIVVGRLGNTMRDQARRLRQQLDHLGAPILGIVVNSAGRDGTYQSAYGYGLEDRTPNLARPDNGARPGSEGRPAAARHSAAPTSTPAAAAYPQRSAPSTPRTEPLAPAHWEPSEAGANVGHPSAEGEGVPRDDATGGGLASNLVQPRRRRLRDRLR
jgi:hypothetical protein